MRGEDECEGDLPVDLQSAREEGVNTSVLSSGLTGMKVTIPANE